MTLAFCCFGGLPQKRHINKPFLEAGRPKTTRVREHTRKLMPNELDDEISQTLQELKDEGHEVDVPENLQKPEAPKVEEPEKPKDEKPDEGKKPDEGEKGKEKKEPSLMPRWQHEVAVKNLEKEKADLQKQLEEKSKTPSPEKPLETAQPEDDIKALAEELGADPDALRKIIDKAAERAKGNQQLPPELQELAKNLPDLQALTQQYKETVAEQEFSKEFEQYVVPLVEKEYPQLSREQLLHIKSTLREKATDSKFLTTPLDVLYRGLDDFRGVVPSPHKGGESGRGSQGRSQEVIDFENMTEEQFVTLDDETQEKYAEYQRQKEKKRK
jgi:hypothetical protein